MSIFPIWAQAAIAAAVLAACGTFAYRQGVAREHDRMAVLLSDEKAAHSEDVRHEATAGFQAQEALRKEAEAAQAEVARIDSQRTKERTDALAENSRLAAALAAGNRRLRIAAVCPAAGGAGSSGVSPAPGTARMGDAGTVELAPEAGRAVLDIRADIIGDQAALRALQDYARACSR